MKASDLLSPGIMNNSQHLRIECAKAISRHEIRKINGAPYDNVLELFFADCVSRLQALNVISVTGVSVAPTAATLTVAAPTVQLTPTVTPANAANKSVTYSTSNAAVATVSGTGLVTRVANGTAVITVTTVDGGRTATSTITCTA